jgi:hypothetical protein
MMCLEVWRGRRIEDKRGRRGEWSGKRNDYIFSLFECFKK